MRGSSRRSKAKDLGEELALKALSVAERAARSVIFKRLKKDQIRDIDITLGILSVKPLSIDIDVGLELYPTVKGVDINALVRKAVDEAVKAVDRLVEGELRRKGGK